MFARPCPPPSRARASSCMPDDPAKAAEVRAWLLKAATDLRAAAVDLDADPPILEDSVFHSQQAVEKCFKAFLAWHDQPFRKTHSLEELGEQCLGLDGTLRPLVDEAVPLTEYAWRFRYPGEPDAPAAEEAETAVSQAREVYEAVLARLPPSTHP